MIYLFLDIDGVINVIPRSIKAASRRPHLRVWPDWVKVDILGYPITYSPTLINHLNRISEKVTIVWLTTWRHHAVNDFAPVVGLKDFDYIDPKGAEYPWGSNLSFSAAPDGRWWKLNGILDHIDTKGEPFIWLDDDLRSNTKKFVRRLSDDMDIPNLMFIPFESKGIEPDHIARIDDFVNLHSK